MPKILNKSHSNKSNLKNSRENSVFTQLKVLVSLIIWLPRSTWAKRLVYGFLALLIVIVSGMYGIAEWYIHSETGPQTLGVTFIPDYAQSLGVDPQANMDALLKIGVKNFRLVSYWSDIEQTPGHYDFSQLDWEFQKAEAAHAHITLTLGLRQPRWPECHYPDWAVPSPNLPVYGPTLKTIALEKFISVVVQRYQHSPALQNYQLENEYFLKGFGICDQIPGAEDRSRLISEYKLVKQLDPNRQIIVARSNNALGFPVGQPQPDEFGISVYKRVWNTIPLLRRYVEYPYPAWFYSYLAGVQKIFNHKDMIVDELQAEAWPPHGQTIPNTSLAEQNKSFDAARFQSRIQYGKATGMRQINLWGAEYWYYRLVVLHDDSLWKVAQQNFSQNQ